MFRSDITISSSGESGASIPDVRLPQIPRNSLYNPTSPTDITTAEKCQTRGRADGYNFSTWKFLKGIVRTVVTNVSIGFHCVTLCRILRLVNVYVVHCCHLLCQDSRHSSGAALQFFLVHALIHCHVAMTSRLPSTTVLAGSSTSRINPSEAEPKLSLSSDLPFGLCGLPKPCQVHFRNGEPNLASPESVTRGVWSVFRKHRLVPLRENESLFCSSRSIFSATRVNPDRLSSILASSQVPSYTESIPAQEMSVADGGRSGHGRGSSTVGGTVSGVIHRPSLSESVRTASSTSAKSSGSNPGYSEEKPIASGNGVSLSISLAEPALYLQGFDQADVSSRATTMLRGTFHLKVSKSAKIKSITLNFRGRAETEWPEGISSWNRLVIS